MSVKLINTLHLRLQPYQPLHFSLASFLLTSLALFAACGGDGNDETLKDQEQIEVWIAERAISLEDTTDLTALFDSTHNRDMVLLGGHSHGTKDFQELKAEISKRLIEEQDFNFIAVEGNWAEIYQLNRYVKGFQTEEDSAKEILQDLPWPQWQWNNGVTENFVEWLKTHNEGLALQDRVGFYGLDLYSYENAMNEIEDYFELFLPMTYGELEDDLECLRQFSEEDLAYSKSIARGIADCREEVKWPLELLKDRENRLMDANRYSYLRALGSAIVLENAEEYYRRAPAGESHAWNTRARHFYEITDRLRSFYGDNARGIIWGNNAQTEYNPEKGDRKNLARFLKDSLGRENLFSLGLSTYQGEIKAADQWGAPGKVIKIPKALEGSIEHHFHKSGLEKFLWVFNEEDRNFPPLKGSIKHRRIGLTYDPASEHRTNYTSRIIPQTYDGMIFKRETGALNPFQSE